MDYIPIYQLFPTSMSINNEAINLKAICWPEELAGLSNDIIDVEKQLISWKNWMHDGFKYHDVRVLIGAFEEDRMLGVAFASFAEDPTDIFKGNLITMKERMDMSLSKYALD